MRGESNQRRTASHEEDAFRMALGYDPKKEVGVKKAISQVTA